MVVRLAAAAVVLGVFSVLFVGLDVLERRLFPGSVPTWLHHSLLTSWAAVMTFGTGSAVYLFMRWHQRDLSATAAQLTRLLESYRANPSAPGRFENPNLRRCRDVLECDSHDCPMYDLPDERCWQVMALARADADHLPPLVEIERCHECDVYRLSCPNRLIELGESFNNVMFLLEQDARQLSRIRAQMVEKEKMVAVGQMASGIAHEVGNPLSSISSIVQMLRRTGAAGTMRERLDLIETHIQRISAIVRQVVSLARPTREHWELLDVADPLIEAVSLVEFDRRARNVTVDFVRPEDLARTYGLRGQLQQVFLNLAINALDAMPDGGTLTIGARPTRDAVVVRIRDTGCGIAEQAGRRIFEPFFTTKDPGHGTGLGLAVSYGIVQKHGGRIEYQSEVGKGTEFIVEIPITDEAPEIEQ